MFSDFEVKMIVEPVNQSKLHYRLFCDQFEFSGDLAQQITAVRQFILSHRKGDKNYPCYLSDIDISLCREQINHGGELFLSHYLRIKNDIEQKLNSTLLRWEPRRAVKVVVRRPIDQIPCQYAIALIYSDLFTSW